MEEIVTYRAQGWRTITYNVQIDDPLDETPRLIRAPRGHDGADPPTITSVHGEWLFNFPLGRSGRKLAVSFDSNRHDPGAPNRYRQLFSQTTHNVLQNGGSIEHLLFTIKQVYGLQRRVGRVLVITIRIEATIDDDDTHGDDRGWRALNSSRKQRHVQVLDRRSRSPHTFEREYSSDKSTHAIGHRQGMHSRDRGDGTMRSGVNEHVHYTVSDTYQSERQSRKDVWAAGRVRDDNSSVAVSIAGGVRGQAHSSSASHSGRDRARQMPVQDGLRVRSSSSIADDSGTPWTLSLVSVEPRIRPETLINMDDPRQGPILPHEQRKPTAKMVKIPLHRTTRVVTMIDPRVRSSSSTTSSSSSSSLVKGGDARKDAQLHHLLAVCQRSELAVKQRASPRVWAPVPPPTDPRIRSTSLVGALNSRQSLSVMLSEACKRQPLTPTSEPLEKRQLSTQSSGRRPTTTSVGPSGELPHSAAMNLQYDQRKRCAAKGIMAGAQPKRPTLAPAWKMAPPPVPPPPPHVSDGVVKGLLAFAAQHRRSQESMNDVHIPTCQASVASVKEEPGNEIREEVRVSKQTEPNELVGQRVETESGDNNNDNGDNTRKVSTITSKQVVPMATPPESVTQGAQHKLAAANNESVTVGAVDCRPDAMFSIGLRVETESGDNNNNNDNGDSTRKESSITSKQVVPMATPPESVTQEAQHKLAAANNESVTVGPVDCKLDAMFSLSPTSFMNRIYDDLEAACPPPPPRATPPAAVLLTDALATRQEEHVELVPITEEVRFTVRNLIRTVVAYAVRDTADATVVDDKTDALPIIPPLVAVRVGRGRGKRHGYKLNMMQTRLAVKRKAQRVADIRSGVEREESTDGEQDDDFDEDLHDEQYHDPNYRFDKNENGDDTDDEEKSGKRIAFKSLAAVAKWSDKIFVMPKE